ncbi:MAG: hypothetical protein ACK4RN_13280 [Pseudorhodobacter sp.]
MLDKTIDSALLALRRQVIREGGDGLDHVEALLVMRVVPMPAFSPRNRSDVARKGLMRLLLLDGIRKGHDTQSALAAYVHSQRPELTARAVYVRTTQALPKLKAAGRVRREGQLWWLVQ